MNHQCPVMNYLKLSGPESDGQDANSGNTVVSCTYQALTSNTVTDEASCSADITWLPTDAQLQKQTPFVCREKVPCTPMYLILLPAWA
jgi:hypothetical protein